MFLNRTMWTLSVIALLLSLVHLGFATASAMNIWSLSVLWFAGSGLSILLAGLLNVAALRSDAADPVIRSVWLIGNVVVAGFFALAWPLLREPQVVVGFAVFASLAICAGLTWVTPKAQSRFAG